MGPGRRPAGARGAVSDVDGGHHRSSRSRAKAACGRSARRSPTPSATRSARTGALLIADEVQCGLGRTGARVRLPARSASSPTWSPSARRSAPACRSARRCVSERVAAARLARRSRQHVRRQPAGVPRGARVPRRADDGRPAWTHVREVGAQLGAGPARARRQACRHPRGARRRPDVGPRSRTSTPRRSSQAALRRGLLDQPDGRRRHPPAAAVRHHRGRGRRGSVARWTRSSPRSSRSVPHDAPNPPSFRSSARAPSAACPRAAAPAPAVRDGARAADAPAIHALIMANLAEGHLLPRTLGDVTAHASPLHRGREREGVVLACGELAPLEPSVAEVRSLVVREDARGMRPGPRHRRRTAPPRPRQAGSGRCARSRTTRGSSCGSGSRSCRTRGCPRRSRPTAGAARSSSSAASTPWSTPGSAGRSAPSPVQEHLS